MLIGMRNAILAGGAAPGPTPAYWGLCFTAEEPNCMVNMAREGTVDLNNKAPVTLEYSTDDCETWTEFDATGKKTTPITLANIGDHVFFRAGEGGNDRFAYHMGAYRHFTLTGNVAASGNIMSLLDASNHSNYSLSGHSALALAFLFYGCPSLTTAPLLPATSLANGCYRQMFYGCTSLTTAPSLPATSLADSCYRQMFYGCKSLTTAPSLPATTLVSNCYCQMFSGCTSLTTAPLLPATTLATYCYNSMFTGCTSLTTAPLLPATSLANGCYLQMFYGCTSLTTAPSLPATTLVSNCYESMFSGCTSLTTAPLLPATTLVPKCYRSMFYGCTSLTTAPSLPATSLADSCYCKMFYGCPSLTTAPSLPATTLVSNCFKEMFVGCSLIDEIEVEFTSWTSDDYVQTTSWLSGVAATGTFYCPTALGTNATITRGVSACPEGWTVINTDA